MRLRTGGPGLGVLLLVLACGDAARDGSARGADTRVETHRAGRSCPVTIAGNPSGAYGRADRLRTIIPPTGTIFAVGPAAAHTPDGYIAKLNRDGTVAAKFPWWRGPGVKARLRITGRSVPDSGRAVTAHLDPRRQTDLQPSTVIFPGDGCWSVTGRAGRARLTFVVFVVDCTAASARCRRE